MRIDAEVMRDRCEPRCELWGVVSVVFLEPAKDGEVVSGKFPANVEILVHCFIIIFFKLPDDLQNQIREAAQEFLPGAARPFGEEIVYDGLVRHLIRIRYKREDEDRKQQRQDREI